MTTSRRVLVTGGSRGIGAAIALRMGSEGADVTLTWRSRREEADEIVRRIRSEGGSARALPLDLAERSSIEALGRRLEEEGQPIDVLVNNAGEIRDRLFLFQSDEDLRHVVEVNLLGALDLTRSALRGMLLRRWGRIVSLASLSGLAGNKGQTNYAAAKGGLVAFSKSLAQEVGSFGVTVNVIAPGFVDTDILSGLPDAIRQGATEAIPLRRFGRPDEIAGIVSWLVSEEAGGLTGLVIRADGGLAS